MNFLFTDFFTAKFWLKIFGEYLEKLLKVLPFSRFLYQFAKNAKNWMPSKKQKHIFRNLDFGPNYYSDIILVTSQKFSHFCTTLFCPIRYANIFQNKMCQKKLSAQNIEERYWFELVSKLSYNVPAKVIVIKISLNH